MAMIIAPTFRMSVQELRIADRHGVEVLHGPRGRCRQGPRAPTSWPDGGRTCESKHEARRARSGRAGPPRTGRCRPPRRPRPEAPGPPRRPPDGRSPSRAARPPRGTPSRRGHAPPRARAPGPRRRCEAIFSAGTSQPCRLGTWRTEMDPERLLALRAPCGARVTSAPMRSSVRVKPMRAVFEAHVLDRTMSLPRTSSRRAHEERGRGRVAGNGALRRALSRHGPVTLAVQWAAVVGTPNSGSMSSVWLRDGRGLTQRGRAAREHARQQHRGLQLGRRHGRVVGDGAQVARRPHSVRGSVSLARRARSARPSS